MKNIHYSLLVVIIALGSCKQAGQIKQPEVLTAEQEQTIIKEVTSVMNATVKKINELNVDSVFNDWSKINFSRFIINGIILNSYDSTYTIFKDIYSKIKKLNFEFTDERYTVLSLNTVLFSASFKDESIDINNNQSRLQGAMTCVFQKTDEKWKMIHVHQSYFPISNKK
jgi:hypothetical protein